MTALLAAALLAAASVPTDAEIWNEGVAFYRAGDVTNALRTIRPLAGRRDEKGRFSRIGRNAAELAAKLCFEQDKPEEAAVYAQMALRADVERRARPADAARSGRNFARATAVLPDWRRTRRINAVLEETRGKDPGAMMKTAVDDARALLSAAGALGTNAPAVRVAQADALSARAEKLSDVWIALRETIAQGVTNEEQAAHILAQVDGAQTSTETAAVQLADLDAGAYASLSETEHRLTAFFKMTALPPLAIDEDVRAQSNAWLDVETVNGRAWQGDALDFTRAFRARFPAWAQAYAQQAQADTNRPPFTAETQAEIAALATRLEQMQISCLSSPDPERQREAVETACRIRDLLPKDPSGGGAPSGSPEAKPKSGDGSSGEPPRQDGKSGDDGASDLGRQEEAAPPPGEEDGSGEERKDDGPTPEEREADAVLRKAQERSDEHEAEKRARMRKAKLPPNERDW